MQQWEYLEVRVGGSWTNGESHRGLWADSQGRNGLIEEVNVSFTAPRRVYGGRQSEQQVGARVCISGVFGILNEFGAEGWELVSVIPHDHYPYVDGFLLKRPNP
jgi:hypothetical protein